MHRHDVHDRDEKCQDGLVMCFGNTLKIKYVYYTYLQIYLFTNIYVFIVIFIYTRRNSNYFI